MTDEGTHPESRGIEHAERIEVVDEAMADVLRRKTPAERLRMASQLWVTAWTMVRAGLHQSHPAWPPDRLDRETASRFLHGTS